MDQNYHDPKVLEDISELKLIGELNILEESYIISMEDEFKKAVNRKIKPNSKIYLSKNSDFPTHMIKSYSDLKKSIKLTVCDYIMINMVGYVEQAIYLKIGEDDYIPYDAYDYNRKYGVKSIEGLKQYINILDDDIYKSYVSNVTLSPEELQFCLKNPEKTVSRNQIELMLSERKILMTREDFDTYDMIFKTAKDYDTVNMAFRSLLNFTMRNPDTSSEIYLGLLLMKNSKRLSDYFSGTITYNYFKFYFNINDNYGNKSSCINALKRLLEKSNVKEQQDFIKEHLEFYNKYAI